MRGFAADFATAESTAVGGTIAFGCNLGEPIVCVLFVSIKMQQSHRIKIGQECDYARVGLNRWMRLLANGRHTYVCCVEHRTYT